MPARVGLFPVSSTHTAFPNSATYFIAIFCSDLKPFMETNFT